MNGDVRINQLKIRMRWISLGSIRITLKCRGISGLEEAAKWWTCILPPLELSLVRLEAFGRYSWPCAWRRYSYSKFRCCALILFLQLYDLYLRYNPYFLGLIIVYTTSPELHQLIGISYKEWWLWWEISWVLIFSLIHCMKHSPILHYIFSSFHPSFIG